MEPRVLLSKNLLARRREIVSSIAFVFFFFTLHSYSATLNVPSVAFPTIQSAVNAANSGDTIVLQAGMTFSEEVVLKYKPGNQYITIQSSAISSLPPDGQRVSPSDAQFMPRLITPNSGTIVFSTEISPNGPAHHYRLIGLEIATASSSQVVSNLIEFGSGSSNQDTLAKVAHNLEIDRCYIHGTTDGETRRGIALNSSFTTISDSHISDIHQTFADAQAIAGWNGPGPYLIENNYLEGSGENVMFGGSDPSIANLVPADIQIRRNLFSKPLSWYPRVPSWSIKNIFELKNAKRVTVTENIFENNWAQSQNGFAILFTVRNQDGSAPWSTIEDVTFNSNIVRNTPRAINVLGQDNIFPSQNVRNLSITNNLIVSSSTVDASDGKCLQIVNVPSGSVGTQDLLVDHNTCVGLGNYPWFIAGDNATTVTGFNIRNNIAMGVTPGTDASIAGNAQFGTAALNSMSGTTWTAQQNILMLPSGSSGYPNSGSNVNYYVSGSSAVGFVDFANGDYRLSSSSPYINLGTDGTNPGANIAGLNSLRPCIESGNWTSCSSSPQVQSSYPGPNPPSIVGTIEAENFDRGGQSIAYNELFGGTGSSTYRSNPTEAVDITANSNASNGFAVFEAAAGEWLEYTASVPSIGLYNFSVRYSSGYSLSNSFGKFRIEVCEPTPVGGVTNCVSTPEVQTYSTGGWGIFQRLSAPLYLPTSGTRIVRLIMVSNAPGDTNCNCVVANFDSISVSGQRSLFDFDGDRKADLSQFRPTNATWYLSQSQNGFASVGFGLSSDTITPSDFDGDNKTDIAVYRASTLTWYVLNSTNYSVTVTNFGLSADIPVQADYDGDQKADLAMWRPSDGTWYWKNSSNGSSSQYAFGSNGDKPAVGDFDGDGKSDFSVYRPSSGLWYLQQSLAGFSAIQLGISTDLIVPSDYDGDGKTDIAVWRPSSGVWYVVNSSNGTTSSNTFGLTNDQPAPADFDGDGKSDLATYRPSSGVWYLQQTTSGFSAISFGLNGDVPTPSTYVR